MERLAGMNDIPVSKDTLENIVAEVAIGLLEAWAIDNRIPDGEETKYSIYAVDDTATVINLFMEKFNEAMSQSQRQSLSI